MTQTAVLRLVEACPQIEAKSNHADPVDVYLRRLASGSRRTMREALAIVKKVLQERGHVMAWHFLRYEHVADVRSVLVERYKPAMVNKVLAAVRGVLRECWRLGLVAVEDYEKARAIEGVKASTLPRGRSLAAGELRVLFEMLALDRGVAGRRDAALLAVLYAAGLRRSEVVALNVEDYDPLVGQVIVREGKGKKDRLTYVTTNTRNAIAAWLAVRGNHAGPLFVPVNKGGVVSRRRLSEQAVLYVLRQRGEAAGVASFSPHDLRRTFVSDMLDAGADIATVQRLAGHANVATTARYDRRGEVAKQKAVELLHVPFTSS